MKLTNHWAWLSFIIHIGKESLHHSEWFEMPLSLEPACWWHLRPSSPPDIEAKTNVGLYFVAPVIENIRGSSKGIIQLLCNYGRNPAPVHLVHLVVYLTICGLYTSRSSAWFLPSTEPVWRQCKWPWMIQTRTGRKVCDFTGVDILITCSIRWTVIIQSSFNLKINCFISSQPILFCAESGHPLRITWI